ncbi:UNKNOWN [Stylonychia lemnae]|uniref:Uncharacterized protein n=1 Tax=Stylonychia lemnae TaxID=5949 RepID=A0A078B6C8_STYLE|nr:UNKNOWN [Stylonychia lemnae]|eukprot:CDW88862.1 UNKNOWN [Stylonychia lemnae]
MHRRGNMRSKLKLKSDRHISIIDDSFSGSNGTLPNQFNMTKLRYRQKDRKNHRQKRLEEELMLFPVQEINQSRNYQNLGLIKQYGLKQLILLDNGCLEEDKATKLQQDRLCYQQQRMISTNIIQQYIDLQQYSTYMEFYRLRNQSNQANFRNQNIFSHQKSPKMNKSLDFNSSIKALKLEQKKLINGSANANYLGQKNIVQEDNKNCKQNNLQNNNIFSPQLVLDSSLESKNMSPQQHISSLSKYKLSLADEKIPINQQLIINNRQMKMPKFNNISLMKIHETKRNNRNPIPELSVQKINSQVVMNQTYLEPIIDRRPILKKFKETIQNYTQQSTQEEENQSRGTQNTQGIILDSALSRQQQIKDNMNTSFINHIRGTRLQFQRLQPPKIQVDAQAQINGKAFGHLQEMNNLLIRSRNSSFGEWDHNKNQSDYPTPRNESMLSKTKFGVNI